MQKTEKAGEAKVAKTGKEKKAATEKVVVAKGQAKNAIERPTTIKEKNYLYKWQLDPKLNKAGAKEQKKLRSKIRRKLQVLVNAIIVANMKKASTEGCKELVAFYKENYILNDFSLKSITASGDEDKQADLGKALYICKKYLANK